MLGVNVSRVENLPNDEQQRPERAQNVPPPFTFGGECRIDGVHIFDTYAFNIRNADLLVAVRRLPHVLNVRLLVTGEAAQATSIRLAAAANDGLREIIRDVRHIHKGDDVRHQPCCEQKVLKVLVNRIPTVPVMF